MEYYLAIKRYELLMHRNSIMNVRIIMLSEGS
jgi:hypothetical protein